MNVPIFPPFIVVALIGVLATPAALACDAALEATVAARPDDTDARDALARSCARAGRQDEALRHYDALLQRDAANVDWLLGKAQALLAQDRPREALPFLEAARRRAPDYEDVWRVNANALDALDEFDAADALLAQAAVQFPDAAWPRERQAALAERRLLERGTRLSVDLSYEELSRSLPAWKGASIGLGRSLSGPRHVFGGLHLEERFDRRDEQLIAAFSDRLSDEWSYGIEVDFAPNADLLPEWSFTGEAGRGLPDAWGVGFRLRHASFQAVDVDLLSAMIDKYTSSLYFGYSLNAVKTSGIDELHFGHVLQVARDYGRDSRVALAVAFGEEAETVAPGVVQVTETKGVSLNGLHWTSAAWGVSWEAGWYEQGDFYDRTRVRLGLEHRF